MSIELTLLISVISICITIMTTQRNVKKDDQADGEKSGMILERLDNLMALVANLDKKFDSQSKEINILRERVTKLEASNKTLKTAMEKISERVFGKKE